MFSKKQIAIFKNLIEIYIHRSFPKRLTPEDFINGNMRSYLRNSLIAEILYKTKDIEK
jgi:predicted HTH transcriptional regulator